MDITRACFYYKFYVFILIFIKNYILPTMEKIRTSYNIKKYMKKPNVFSPRGQHNKVPLLPCGLTWTFGEPPLPP